MQTAHFPGFPDLPGHSAGKSHYSYDLCQSAFQQILVPTYLDETQILHSWRHITRTWSIFPSNGKESNDPNDCFQIHTRGDGTRIPLMVVPSNNRRFLMLRVTDLALIK